MSGKPFLKIVSLTLVITFTFTNTVGYTDFPSSLALKNSEIYHARIGASINGGRIDDYLISEGLRLPAHLIIPNEIGARTSNLEPRTSVGLAKSELRYTEKSKINRRSKSNITFTIDGETSTYNKKEAATLSLQSVVIDVLNIARQKVDPRHVATKPWSNLRITAILINGEDASIETDWLESTRLSSQLDDQLRAAGRQLRFGNKVEIQIETRRSELRVRKFSIFKDVTQAERAAHAVLIGIFSGGIVGSLSVPILGIGYGIESTPLSVGIGIGAGIITSAVTYLWNSRKRKAKPFSVPDRPRTKIRSELRASTPGRQPDLQSKRELTNIGNGQAIWTESLTLYRSQDKFISQPRTYETINVFVKELKSRGIEVYLVNTGRDLAGSNMLSLINSDLAISLSQNPLDENMVHDKGRLPIDYDDDPLSLLILLKGPEVLIARFGHAIAKNFRIIIHENPGSRAASEVFVASQDEVDAAIIAMYDEYLRLAGIHVDHQTVPAFISTLNERNIAQKIEHGLDLRELITVTQTQMRKGISNFIAALAAKSELRNALARLAISAGASAISGLIVYWLTNWLSDDPSKPIQVAAGVGLLSTFILYIALSVFNTNAEADRQAEEIFSKLENTAKGAKRAELRSRAGFRLGWAPVELSTPFQITIKSILGNPRVFLIEPHSDKIAVSEKTDGQTYLIAELYDEGDQRIANLLTLEWLTNRIDLAVGRSADGGAPSVHISKRRIWHSITVTQLAEQHDQADSLTKEIPEPRSELRAVEATQTEVNSTIGRLFAEYLRQSGPNIDSQTMPAFISTLNEENIAQAIARSRGSSEPPIVSKDQVAAGILNFIAAPAEKSELRVSEGILHELDERLEEIRNTLDLIEQALAAERAKTNPDSAKIGELSAQHAATLASYNRTNEILAEERTSTRSELRQPVSHVTITKISYPKPLPAGVNEQDVLAAVQQAVKDTKAKSAASRFIAGFDTDSKLKGFTYEVKTDPASPDLVTFEISRLEKIDDQGKEAFVSYVTGTAALSRSELRASSAVVDDFATLGEAVERESRTRLNRFIHTAAENLRFLNYDEDPTDMISFFDYFKRSEANEIIGNILTQDLVLAESETKKGQELLWALRFIVPKVDRIAFVVDSAGEAAIRDVLQGISIDHVIFSRGYRDADRELVEKGANRTRILASEREKAFFERLGERYESSVEYISRNEVSALYRAFGIRDIVERLSIQLRSELRTLRSA